MANFRQNLMILVAGQSNADDPSDMGNATSPLNDVYISAGGGEQTKIRLTEQAQCAADFPAACAIEFPWHRMECRSPTGNTLFGPWLPISVDLNANRGRGTATDANFWIVNCATGGTNLAEDWNASSPVGGRELYQRMQDYYALRVAEIEASAFQGPVTFAGFHWDQGEADGDNMGFADDYEVNLQDMVDRVALDFGPAPFIIRRMSTAQTITFGDTIRTAEDDVATANARVRIYNTDDLVTSDGTHFVADSTILSGQRSAAEIIAGNGW